MAVNWRKTKSKTKHVFYVTDETYERLAKLAHRADRSVSWFVERSLVLVLDRLEAGTPAGGRRT